MAGINPRDYPLDPDNADDYTLELCRECLGNGCVYLPMSGSAVAECPYCDGTGYERSDD